MRRREHEQRTSRRAHGRGIGLALGIALAAGAGCSASDAPSASEQALTEGATPLEPGAPGAGAGTTAGSDEAANVGPPAHAAIPAWVPASLHEGIDRSRLAVLLPREPAVAGAALATGQVLSMDRWVSTRIETSTYIVTIFGTDAHHEPPRGAAFSVPEPDHTVRGAPAYVYENEGLFYVQWPEDGAAWEVELECLGSCDGLGMATRIAESLEPVGGVS